MPARIQLCSILTLEALILAGAEVHIARTTFCAVIIFQVEIPLEALPVGASNLGGVLLISRTDYNVPNR